MTSHTLENLSRLDWTGERMVPNCSDAATELFHWQRYLYFRPWYVGKRVIDAASGEGYGTGYAANFATEALGFDISTEAVVHASQRYGKAQFSVSDVCSVDYSEADLVVSFETIEHLPDPSAFLKALAACRGRIVISTPNRKTHSPNNGIEDRPLNPFHTIEWTPSEFANFVGSHFTDREVRFLSQEARWPGLIREGLDEDAMYTIAVIGEGELPKWPRLGIAMPTIDGAARVRDAVLGMTKFYPGEIEFAVVANGSSPEHLAGLRQLETDLPHIVHVIELEKNIGYGMGANAGLDYLWQEGWFDLFGVTNDDVLPAADCLCQMAIAMDELKKSGQKPGIIGPVSNEVAGSQRVDIGSYSNYHEMLDLAELYHREHHSVGTQVMQVRGLFWLVDPDCFSEVGGFDPRFGNGNFEDDDYNLRCRLAGYSLWIAEGAFLHHQGSATFGELGVDYDNCIQRNLSLMLEKWGLGRFEQAFAIEAAPNGVSLHIPLTAKPISSGYTFKINHEMLDLVHQASDIEFAAYVMNTLQRMPREARVGVIESLQQRALAA